MEPELTEEEQAMVDLARRFGEKEIAPVIGQADRDRRYPIELVKKMAELGFMGGVVPEAYGGAGLRHIAYVRVIEELSKFDHYVAGAATSASGLRGNSILRFGTEEQRQRWLVPLAKGEVMAGSGVTEPHSGSDVAAMETTARLEGDHYVLNGEKAWIGGATHADWFLTFATLDRSNPRSSICAFVVERGTPGFSSRPYGGKMGFRVSDSGELVFEDCRVPVENRIGEEGDGLKIALNAVENGRLGTAARACGVLAACLEASVEYAKDRVTFGEPIGRYQLIQSKITDMVVRLQNARNLTYDLAMLRDSGVVRARAQAAMAKMYATDALMASATDAVQIHGAYGISEEYPVERYFRDAKVFQIVEGTNELQRVLIAEYALGYRRDKPT